MTLYLEESLNVGVGTVMLAKIPFSTLLISLVFLLLITTNYAQTNNTENSYQTKQNNSNIVTKAAKSNNPDSLKTSISQNETLMHLTNKFNRIISPNNKSPYFPIISIPDHLYQKYNYIESNRLDSFKQNFSRSLSYGYHEIDKYNLGVAGNYLGKAKDLFAVVLAILS